MAIHTKRNLKKLRDSSVMGRVTSHNGVTLIRTTIGTCRECKHGLNLYDNYKKVEFGQFTVECPECGHQYFLSPIV